MEKFNTLAIILKTFDENINTIKSDVSETRSDVEAIKKDLSDIKAMLERLMVSSSEEPDRIPTPAPQTIEEAPQTIPATAPQTIEEAPQTIEALTSTQTIPTPAAPERIEEAPEPYDWRKDIAVAPAQKPDRIRAPKAEPIPTPAAPERIEEAPEPIPAAPAPTIPVETRARYDALSSVQRRGIARAFLLTITPAVSADILRNPFNLSWDFCANIDAERWRDYVETMLH